ncbi:hypothetical protein [Microvirga guangxiensis]|uniref:Uncharacterized protein n=1 Tax=Microvirga guangxiensis TaxID=549386 RepID=A0A1G5E7U3_9HYPH|nr:hypothetical protein [Microvirga guangxiensis]SCY22760.1 hypothetical protein SAMN02927923_00904 [Microvirga guangxiensis]
MIAMSVVWTNLCIEEQANSSCEQSAKQTCYDISNPLCPTCTKNNSANWYNEERPYEHREGYQAVVYRKQAQHS